MRLRNKKTGEIDDFIFEVIFDRIDLYRRVGTEETKNVYSYNSLAELNEEWEDVKAPLIKNEKIRKAVRVWAEANGVKKIIVFDCGNNAPFTPVGAVDFAENGSHLEIRFRTEERFDTDRIYTITELCGEEE